MNNGDWEGESYFLVESGKPQGPFSWAEMQQKKLKGTDFVRTASMPEFKELREIAGLAERLQVKFEYTLPQYFATLDTRLLAVAIDYFLAFFIYACVIAIWLAGDTEPASTRIPAILLGMVSVPIFKFLLSVILEGSSLQGTFGKALIGIHVTDAKGRKIGFGLSLARNLAKITGVLSLGIGFFVGFFDAQQRCWHDRIAGTLVVRKRLI
jgi:uncharacterized RDD family membrane protein YckC